MFALVITLGFERGVQLLGGVFIAALAMFFLTQIVYKKKKGEYFAR